jgi:hypothetical protein
VVLESTYGWYWAADILQELAAHVQLAHALGNDWGNPPVTRSRIELGVDHRTSAKAQIQG